MTKRTEASFPIRIPLCIPQVEKEDWFYVKKGLEFHESMMQFDVASTIAYLFGLKQPQVWIGRPMTQVFK